MTCPKCGTLGWRVAAVGVVQCALCGTQYPGPSNPMPPSYYSLQPEPLPPRGLVARVRGALRGAVVGWKGGVL